MLMIKFHKTAGLESNKNQKRNNNHDNKCSKLTQYKVKTCTPTKFQLLTEFTQ